MTMMRSSTFLILIYLFIFKSDLLANELADLASHLISGTDFTTSIILSSWMKSSIVLSLLFVLMPCPRPGGTTGFEQCGGQGPSR